MRTPTPAATFLRESFVARTAEVPASSIPLCVSAINSEDAVSDAP
jgi:hypothetical protein